MPCRHCSSAAVVRPGRGSGQARRRAAALQPARAALGPDAAPGSGGCGGTAEAGAHGGDSANIVMRHDTRTHATCQHPRDSAALWPRRLFETCVYT